jgi:hypothetical protein
VDLSFKYCPNCSTSLNWEAKPRAKLLPPTALAVQSTSRRRYEVIIPVVLAVLMLVVAMVGYLSYRFPSRSQQVPVGYESFQELEEVSEPYVMASPDYQFTGNPPHVLKGPGEYIYLTNNDDAGNVSFKTLKEFIVSDGTDKDLYIPGMRMCGHFAETVHNNAEKIGIRAGVVILEFEDGSAPHALNAFETTDKGLVYIDCTGSRRTPSDFEEWLYRLFYPRGQDRIAYLLKGKEYGTILLEDAESMDYNFYAGYSKSWAKDEHFFFTRPGIVKTIMIYW